MNIQRLTILAVAPLLFIDIGHAALNQPHSCHRSLNPPALCFDFDAVQPYPRSFVYSVASFTSALLPGHGVFPKWTVTGTT